MEGRRALPVEVQALTIKTSAPNPRRIVNGVEASRVAMVLAVLERRAGVVVSDHDVYVSTVGGVRLVEPAADLAIAVAVANAVSETALAKGTAAIGELSLAGEVRPVMQAAQRRAEAERLGYRTVVDAGSKNLRGALGDLSLHAVRPGRRRESSSRPDDEPGF